MSRGAYVVARGADTDAFSGEVPRDRPVGGHAKRAIDITLAAIALVLLAPMFLLITTLVLVSFRRPVFVAQQRVGFRGRRFTTYLFRTSPNHGARNQTGEPALITCLAGSLRDSGLDGLPQLVSILRGDMTFVGPRPISLDRSGHGHPDYFAARPGLIGVYRTDRFGRLGERRRAAIDRYYARRWTIWLDLAALWGSLATVSSPK
jgi:lipopolysaccharide/colanic/teichoic acid biosynthesis glycosyltransferase